MKRGVLVFALFILAFANFSAAVGIYDSIPIQIQTLDDAGAISVGTYTFKIDISNSATCSPVLYTNTTTLTTDARGVVSYNLDNVDLDFDEQYWFCYYRDGVLKSTIKAARVPYAFGAKNVTSSGINVNSNLDMGGYNVSASNFLGSSLNVTGNISIGAGQISYNASDNKYYYYNTTEWVEIGSGAGSSGNYINSIVESGNNSNGYYIKFIDGTMIAWGGYSYSASPGTIVYGSFPVSFFQTPSVVSTQDASYGTTKSYAYSYNTTHFGAYSSETTRTIYWHAIGKWTNTPYDDSTITVGGGIPAGAIVAYNRTSCPVGWTLADGNSGTPDLRGIFIRGSGTNSILKYANGSYFSSVLGSYKNDSLQGHHHAAYGQNNVPDASNPTGAILAGNTIYKANGAVGGQMSVNQVKEAITGTNGVPRTGAETSPAYYSTIYCVKMTEDSATSNTIWATSGNNVLLNNNSMNVNIVSDLTVNNSKVRVTRTSAQTFSSGVGAIILYNNEVHDTLNEFNTSNGRFTASKSGYYLVNAFVFFNTGTWSAGQQVNFDLVKNGVGYSSLYHHIFEGTLADKYYSMQGTAMIYLEAGDFITIALAQYTGGDRTLYGDGYYNYLDIIRIP